MGKLFLLDSYFIKWVLWDIYLILLFFLSELNIIPIKHSNNSLCGKIVYLFILAGYRTRGKKSQNIVHGPWTLQSLTYLGREEQKLNLYIYIYDIYVYSIYMYICSY